MEVSWLVELTVDPGRLVEVALATGTTPMVCS